MTFGVNERIEEDGVMTSRKWTFVSLSTAAVVLLLVVAATGGCATISSDEEQPGDPEALQEEARNFHTNLRWARYEHAADSVHPTYRPSFEGEYEERGEDFEILDMRMKSADLVEEGLAAHVEVQQQWMELPSTVVESERFVERWVFEDDRWMMRERMRRDEYRQRDEVFDSERGDGDEPAAGESPQGAGQ